MAQLMASSSQLGFSQPTSLAQPVCAIRPSQCYQAGRQLTPAAALQDHDSRGPSGQELPPNPWPFSFQCNERYLAWSDGAQIRLLKLHVCHKLGQRMTWVETRLEQLMGLLPDLMQRIEHMKADMLVDLVENCEQIAAKAVRLKQMMPGTNISALVSAWPDLVLHADLDKMEVHLAELRELLGDRFNADQVVQQEPKLLAVNTQKLLDELQRLMPSLKDPVGFLVSSPRVVLDMGSAGMPSTIDGDLMGNNAKN